MLKKMWASFRNNEANPHTKGPMEVNRGLLLCAVSGNAKKCSALLKTTGWVADHLADSFLQQTALHLAARYGFVDCCALLIDAGWNVNKKDALGNTPMDWAEQKSGKMKESLHALLTNAGATEGFPDSENKTGHLYLPDSFHRLVIFRNWERIKEKTSNFESIDEENDKGETPLFTSMRARDYDGSSCVKLIRLGANANHMAHHGARPIHFAVSMRNPFALLYLLKSGADPNAECSGGTPLTMAVCKNSPNICDILLKHGAHVGAVQMVNGKPMNALEIAKMLDHQECTRLFSAFEASKIAANAIDSVLKLHQ